MTFTSPNERLLGVGAVHFEHLQRHPWQIVLCVGLFFILSYVTNTSVALFWAVLLLGLLIDLPARPFLLAALVMLTATPVLYFFDRPAQAERVGVVVFSLLALGTILNLINAWRRTAP